MWLFYQHYLTIPGFLPPQAQLSNSMLQRPPNFPGSLFYSSELEVMLVILNVDVKWHEINFSRIYTFIQFGYYYFCFLSEPSLLWLTDWFALYDMGHHPFFRILCIIIPFHDLVHIVLSGLVMYHFIQSSVFNTALWPYYIHTGITCVMHPQMFTCKYVYMMYSGSVDWRKRMNKIDLYWKLPGTGLSCSDWLYIPPFTSCCKKRKSFKVLKQLLKIFHKWGNHHSTYYLRSGNLKNTF